jgi:membrane protease YdiL (CAAX protease family)
MLYPERFQKWLKKPASASEVVYLIFGIFTADVLYNVIIVAILYALNLIPVGAPTEQFSLAVQLVSAAVAGIWEEIAFRILPLTYALRRWKTEAPTLWVLVISAGIFGYVHGGLLHLLAQGITGLLYGILFIKLSEQGRRPLRAGLMLIALHTTFDLCAVLIIHAVS